MARYGLAGALIALALAAGCGSQQETGPAYSDDELLAGELSIALHHQPLSAAKAGPDAAKEAMLNMAIQACRVLREADDAEIISTDTSFRGNTIGITSVIDGMRHQTTWSKDQTMAALTISAKYKCPEFSPMLRVYTASR
ncbi:hypothetical protein [Nocardia fusca]|uniref:DUF732 domain-containing protein n=1 Tax=Nocardia fusca TaxID=941183 RepID=A0ABV3FIG5_9NOCA